MNFLVIGGGGREHALCWKLRQSPLVEALFCAPGNPGIERVAQCVNIPVDDVAGLAKFAADQKIDLTIVGPELSLSLGIVDAFRERGLKIFGPTREAAMLETSKSFAKEIMQQAKVDTAACKVFTDKASSEAYLAIRDLPIVLKADGLAAGKGVFVCTSRDEVKEGLDKIFGELKSQRIVVEDHISGKEVSFIIATDGTRVVPLSSSHDYKRLLDNHDGPNTGGMGSVSPSPYLGEGSFNLVLEKVIHPVLREMKARGAIFTGFLYAGLMIGDNGCFKVLEFNARLGDPETQVLMRRLEGDLAELLLELCKGKESASSSAPAIKWSEKSAVCVVLASGGYPHSVQKGEEIHGLEFSEVIPDVVVFHAGTSRNSKGAVVTSGGRVLNVTGTGDSVEAAAKQAYRGVDMIQYKGRQARRDIGK